MSKELERILERLEQILPPPPPPTDWKASIAFRWRRGARGQGWLQPVRHVHRMRLADLQGIDAQIAKIVGATLPDIRITAPKAQLQEEIDGLQQRLDLLHSVIPASGSTSVDIMRAIAAAIPTKIRVDSDEYTLDPDAVRLRANPEPEGLRAALAEAFGDPSLEIAYWIGDGRGHWAGEAGHDLDGELRRLRVRVEHVRRGVEPGDQDVAHDDARAALVLVEAVGRLPLREERVDALGERQRGPREPAIGDRRRVGHVHDRAVLRAV